MRRGGGDGEEYLTISPPPEFQDPVVALPPPPVFRDGGGQALLEQELANAFRNSNRISDSSSCVSSGGGGVEEEIHEFQQRENRTEPESPVCVKDFATKVSSDILNKAMVIAKDSPDEDEEHATTTASTTASSNLDNYQPTQSTASSCSYSSSSTTHDTADPSSCGGTAPREEDPADTSTITTTTSWEYIPKSSSLSDLTRLGASFLHPQPLPPTQQNEQQSKTPASNNHHHHHHQPTLPHGIVPLPPPHRHSSSSKNPVLRSASFNVHSSSPQEQESKKRNARVPRQRHAQQAIVLVAENPLNGASEVYNVPFQADIYSLPIDTVNQNQQQKQQQQQKSEKNNLHENSFNRNCGARRSNPVRECTRPPVRWSSLSTELKENNDLNGKGPLFFPPPPHNNFNGQVKLVLGQDSVKKEVGSCGGASTSQIQEQPNLNAQPPTKPQSNLNVYPDDIPPTPPTRKHNSSNNNNHHNPHEPSLFTKPKQLNPNQSVVLHQHRTFSQFKDRPCLKKPINEQPAPPPSTTTATRTNSVVVHSIQSSTSSSVQHPPPPPLSSIKSSATNDHPPVPPKRTSIQTPQHVDVPPVPPVRTNCSSVKKPRSKSVDPEVKMIEDDESSSSPCMSSSTATRNPLGLSFLNLFRRNKCNGRQEEHLQQQQPQQQQSHQDNNHESGETPYYFRELPPPPPGGEEEEEEEEEEEPSSSPLELKDFAASIERVKDCGWYWGPLSSEDAEELLKNEPDGSFIVRDSSDARYIFSLTFKLHGLVRHVRIEHDQGNFSFGPLTRFKANTIVDFVEKAVAHSRSGRYLFFLHRRPVLGPMQVQLLHPYSRFLHPRSLKHMCRFVILKYVRRDLIHTLPLPKPLQDYLNTPHYYFEGSSAN